MMRLLDNQNIRLGIGAVELAMNLFVFVMLLIK